MSYFSSSARYFERKRKITNFMLSPTYLFLSLSLHALYLDAWMLGIREQEGESELSQLGFCSSGLFSARLDRAHLGNSAWR